MLSSRSTPEVMSLEERRRRSREADEELREVSERLETELRTSQPELFDRRGRLRTAKLTHWVSERLGGKATLSGDDLRALEDAADGRIRRAP
jgi:hypothetical protein